MAFVYDFVSPDGSPVEESRSIAAPGATVGDVLTVQADESIAPATPAVSGVSSVTDGSTTVDPATSIDFTSGATVTDGGSGVAQVAVGGSQPVQGIYAGNNVSIANGASEQLTWDTVQGDELLDRTDPANPVLLASGTYALTLTAASTAPLTAAGYAVLVNQMADLGFAGGIVSTALPDSVGLLVTAIGILTAGQTLVAQVSNFDGASSRNFFLSSAVLVKLA